VSHVSKFLALVVGILIPTCAYAHGAQIQIGVTNNQIVTHALFDNEPYQAATPVQRVYAIPMIQRALGDANDGWYAAPNQPVAAFAGPGVALLDNNFATGSILKVTFLDGLKRWNGSAFVDPGTEQIAGSTSSLFAPQTLTSDAGPFGTITLSAASGASNDHKTLRWRLLGDGASPNTASDDGVYLLSLQLSTDQPGITPSDPYCFLLNKNATPAEAAAALAFANANLVPEPAGLAALAIVVGTLFPRPRRRAV
jgi:hypothetical protein